MRKEELFFSETLPMMIFFNEQVQSFVSMPVHVLSL